jgi:hypothetical protein
MFGKIVEVWIGNNITFTQVNVVDLKIEFDIEKTNTINPNTATIKIYNLSENSRGLISNIKKPQDAWILVRAGYLDEQGAQDIYKGNIIRITNQKEPPNVIITIEAQDGIYQSNIRLSLGYPSGTPIKRIISDITKKMKVTIDSGSVELPTNTTFRFSTIGRAEDSLNRLCAKINYEWCIINGKIKFTKKGDGDMGKTLRLDYNSGLIGSPVKVHDAVRDNDKMNAGTGGFQILATKQGNYALTIQGWEVTSLLQPTIEPKSKIIIKSEDMDEGAYIVEKVQHKGDNWDGDFQTISTVFRGRL